MYGGVSGNTRSAFFSCHVRQAIGGFFLRM
nr:MAG TPA: hypothetical protein [Caudoviricetes sp.]DAK04600.1 MAG TPA: hypothetical protein [Caudoviricetes sp.]DAV85562.1 MAG TPA: hypothetical protein [Caudoviricetes sp.]